MILIGMLDSPFVRRVAVSMRVLGIDFEHRGWSVGKDFDRIREFNPLGRVPTLVLDDGEVLCESSAILDYIDELAGERALLPRSGAPRRHALHLMALASGAAEKAVLQLYEQAFRPADKRHAPWVERCRTQMQDALAELERICSARARSSWMIGDRQTQADITAACVFSFVCQALAPLPEYPALRALVERHEALPEFRATRMAFFPPEPRP